MSHATARLALNYQERGNSRRDIIVEVVISEEFNIHDSGHFRHLVMAVREITGARRDWRFDDVRFKVCFKGRAVLEREMNLILAAVCEGVERMFIPTALGA